MKVPFDKVIVSCDDEPTFLNFWPVVVSAWYKFFPDVQVELALVTDMDETDPVLETVRSYGKVVTYPLISGIPKSNQGKICRSYHASLQGSNVCSLHDMDTVPLQRNYLFDLLSRRKKDCICLIGGEVYENTLDAGKFPLVPTTAEGHVFKNIYRADDKSYGEFVNELVGLNVFDEKENILNQPFTNFSDESVMRVFLSKYSGEVQKLRRDELRPLDNRMHWIDRSGFSVDIEKLYSGFYTEINMLRPLKENYIQMQSVIDYVCENYVPII
tara:strand:+ start:2283 stop:3095 length:813 start_codon:yes stop_codon:yes gene_type:complete